MKNLKFLIPLAIITFIISFNFNTEKIANADIETYDTMQAEILDKIDNTTAVITLDNGSYYIISMNKDDLFFIGDIIDVTVDSAGDPINLIEYDYDWSLLFR